MKNLVLFLCVIGLAACSSDSGGGDVIPGTGLPQPSGKQKNRMGRFAQEVVDVQNGTAQQNSQASSENGGSVEQNPVQIGRFVSQVAKEYRQITTSSKGEDLAKAIQEAIDSGDCQVATVGIPENSEQAGGSELQPSFAPFQPSANPNSVNEKIEVKIGGKNSKCMIYSLFSISISGNVVEGPQSVTMNMGFDFKNDFSVNPGTHPVLNELDIYAYSTAIKMNMSLNANQGGFNMAMNGSGSTSISSVESLEGDVTLNTAISMGVSGTNENNLQANFQVVSDYRFVDFQVVGVIRGSASGAQTEPALSYYINGVGVTEQEYFELFAGTMTHDSLASTVPQSSTKSETETSIGGI